MPARALAVALAAIGAALWLPTLTLLPIADDPQPAAWADQFGLNVLFQAGHFRFWERSVHALLYAASPAHMVPLSVALSLGAFVTSAALVWRIAAQLAPGRRALAPLLATACYVLHPGNVSSVAQLDTLSQALATPLMLLCIRLLVFGDWLARPRCFAAAVALLLATLLAKETVLGMAAWLPLAAGLRAAVAPGPLPATPRGRFAAAAIALTLAFALYLALRLASGTPLVPAASDRYSLHLDLMRVVLNAAQLAGAALFFGNSAAAMTHGVTPGVALAAAISAAAGALVLATLVRGLARPWPAANRPRWRELALWLSFAPGAMVPMIAMGSVSELYVAGLTPFVAIGYGVCFAAVIGPTGSGRAAALLAAALLASGAWSVRAKVDLQETVSQRTWDFVRALQPALQACGGHSAVLLPDASLAAPTTGREPYSAFSEIDAEIARKCLGDLQDPHRRGWIAQLARDLPPGGGGVTCVTEPPADPCSIRCRRAAP